MNKPRSGRPADRHHGERHNSHRVGWLRAAVLGANDGTISVASLVVGIAASGASVNNIMLSGLAATVAGAVSMAAGEFVSVQSQVDTERADLAKERHELATDPQGELAELALIYRQRGLDPNWPTRWRNNSLPTMPLGPMPAMNWASPKPCGPGRSRRP